MNIDAFDYIIVGAGSAGCVLAHRLSENRDIRVALLEFGGSDASPFIQMPAALAVPMNSPRYDWGFTSEPEPQLNHRRLHVPRGKVLGGSSSINGMVYVRGHAQDFDGWAAMGATGWRYADVLPYFRRAENFAGGGDAYRGDSGPLHTRRGTMNNPLYHAFVAAGIAAGFGQTADVNGFRQEGFGALDMSVHQGQRWSAANAYLKPARGRQNLDVRTGCLVTQLMVAGRRATGVTYRQNGQMHQMRARREVILAAGAINSPHLLKVSGIGPAAELRQFGIEVVHDLPAVGQNLMDHLELYFQLACRQPISLYGATGLFAKAMIGLRWLAFRDGLGATNHFEAGGFIRSRASVVYPDIQFHFLPLAISYDGKTLAAGHGFQAHVGPMRSRSRGTISLQSPDARTAPKIMFNYMSDAQDSADMRACVRLTREIFAMPAFDAFRGDELQPGVSIIDDAAIDAFVRAKAQSAYHPCGACRMGMAHDSQTVVDPECRIVGMEGLRVVDSSIMPLITNGNLNAPTIMLAEKASDHILQRATLPPANVAVYQAGAWRQG